MFVYDQKNCEIGLVFWLMSGTPLIGAVEKGVYM